MIWRHTALIAAAAFAAVAVPALALPAPHRVVSMNLCTDQLAMLIAAPGQLISVSDLAIDPRLAVMADEAAAYPANKGAAEEIFLLQPDLVLAGAYSVNGSIQLLRRLGLTVEQFAPADSFDTVRAHIARMGTLLGREARAAEVRAAFDDGLAAARAVSATGRTALTYEPNGYTLGRGTLTDEVIEAAGYDNLAARLGIDGMRMVSLEAVVMQRPDLVMTSESWGLPALADQSGTHPALRKAAARHIGPVAPNKYLICGTPFVTRAVELIRALPIDAKAAP